MTAVELEPYSESDLMVMAMTIESRPQSFCDDPFTSRNCLEAITSELQVRELRRLGYTLCLKDWN